MILLILLVLSNDRRIAGGQRNPAWINWTAALTALVALAAAFGALVAG